MVKKYIKLSSRSPTAQYVPESGGERWAGAVCYNMAKCTKTQLCGAAPPQCWVNV